MRFGRMKVLGCVVTALALASSGALAQNILMNPDFETGDLTGWQVFGTTANSSATVVMGQNGPTAPGNHAAFLENRAQALGFTLKQSTLPGSAGPGTVSYSFDLKLGEAANGGVFFVEVFAEQDGVGIVGGSGLLGNYTPATWTTYSGTFLAPAGTDFLTIQLTAVTGAVEGSVSTMYVDNVIVESEGAVADDATSWSGVKALYR